MEGGWERGSDHYHDGEPEVAVGQDLQEEEEPDTDLALHQEGAGEHVLMLAELGHGQVVVD